MELFCHFSIPYNLTMFVEQNSFFFKSPTSSKGPFQVYVQVFGTTRRTSFIMNKTQIQVPPLSTIIKCYLQEARKWKQEIDRNRHAVWLEKYGRFAWQKSTWSSRELHPMTAFSFEFARIENRDNVSITGNEIKNMTKNRNIETMVDNIEVLTGFHRGWLGS